MSSSIHPTAVIDETAAIGANNDIGAYCVIGPHVVIGDNNKLHSHVVVEKYTSIGSGNEIFQFASIVAIYENHESFGFIYMLGFIIMGIIAARGVPKFRIIRAASAGVLFTLFRIIRL